MIRNTSILFIVCLLILGNKNAFGQQGEIIQISGVTMTADSLHAVPFVTVTVKGQNRGANSNEAGIFSLATRKGDTLHFSLIGYRSKDYVIDKNLKGTFFNMVQLMVQDTFYLPETIIRPIPSDFDYAFKYWDFGEDQYTTAMRNTSRQALLRVMYSLPKNGAENQSYYQMQEVQNSYYYGQQKPMNILNPFKWAEFIEAWKRGDYRKKE